MAIRALIATIAILLPPIIFEKSTYFFYTTGSRFYGTFSYDRLWFDIIWFCIGGALSVIIVGRKTKAVVLPPLLASLIFTIAVYVVPFCTVKECYVSSADGLAPLRDLLLFGALGVTTSAASMKSWYHETKSRGAAVDTVFQLSVAMFMGYALSFFPIMHIFAGVSILYSENYLQWFLAGAPAGVAGSMWIIDRGNVLGILSKFFAGSSGVGLALALGVEIPCEVCSGYSIPVSSIFLLALAFCIPAILLELKRKRSVSAPRKLARNTPGIITTDYGCPHDNLALELFRDFRLSDVRREWILGHFKLQLLVSGGRPDICLLGGIPYDTKSCFAICGSECEFRK